MFGLLDDVLDLGAAVTKVAINTAVSPITNTLDILDGMSEGEFRTEAAIKLGAGVVSGMSISEISIALELL